MLAVGKSPTITISETLFEGFCKSVGIVLKRIETMTGVRTPDYELESVQPISPIAEIKQLDPNPDGKIAIEELRKQGITARVDRPGRRVGLAITSAIPQLRKMAKGIRPAMVVLYNNVDLGVRSIDPYHVRTGMYGLEAVELGVPPVGSTERPVVRGYRRGGREKVTPQHNTTLSAVAVLNDLTPEVTLEVYHNRFAEIPLDLAQLAHPRIRHFTISDGEPGERSEWVEITSGRKPNESARKKLKGSVRRKPKGSAQKRPKRSAESRPVRRLQRPRTSGS